MTKKASMVAVVVLICLLTMTLTVSAETVNVLENGSFEGPFVGGVAEGWTAFNNGGLAGYSYSDDVWEKTVYDGEHSQLLAIHTKAVGGSEYDRYNGIYQTVNVVPGQRYMFSFYGMIRSTEGHVDKSGYGYRVEIAFDDQGGSDPWAPLAWQEMDRWPEYALKAPGVFQGYAHGVTPTTDKMTVFIRVWKKFPTVQRETWVNLDAVSLLGPSAGVAQAEAVTTDAATTEEMPDTGAGYLLQMVGAVLGIAAVGLTGRRLARGRA